MTAVVNIEASEPKAKEPLIIMLMVVVLLILTVVEVILGMRIDPLALSTDPS